MEEKKEVRVNIAEKLFFVFRIEALFTTLMLFLPAMNPAKISKLIDTNVSLFTTAMSYTNLINQARRGIRRGWIDQTAFITDYYSAYIVILGIVLVAIAACMSVGNLKMKKTGILIGIIGSAIQVSGIIMIHTAYNQMFLSKEIEKAQPILPIAFYIYLVVSVLALVISIANYLLLPKVDKTQKYQMESKYKLFLMFMPFAVIAFVFCYLPLWGWRYAFFDYKAGDTLTWSKFVGLKWFHYLFENKATKSDVISVLKNTLAMSGLNLITLWIPMFFAIFLSEVKSIRFKRFVQTFTTIPNFISWVLVYAIALSIFSTDGFVNTFAKSIGLISQGTNFMMGDSHTWLKMLAWGLWKGIGWSAIIYIAGIAGIDKQLYEAATVDGAGRFQKMRYVTIPGLLPTFFVLLLMAVAGILNNGMDQYLVFANASNTEHIRVLDLYVYQLGIKGGSIPLSTLVGMVKSIISVALLFVANGASKAIRGESIV